MLSEDWPQAELLACLCGTEELWHADTPRSQDLRRSRDSSGKFDLEQGLLDALASHKSLDTARSSQLLVSLPCMGRVCVQTPGVAGAGGRQ